MASGMGSVHKGSKKKKGAAFGVGKRGKTIAKTANDVYENLGRAAGKALKEGAELGGRVAKKAGKALVDGTAMAGKAAGKALKGAGTLIKSAAKSSKKSVRSMQGGNRRNKAKWW